MQVDNFAALEDSNASTTTAYVPSLLQHPTASGGAPQRRGSGERPMQPMLGQGGGARLLGKATGTGMERNGGGGGEEQILLLQAQAAAARAAQNGTTTTSTTAIPMQQGQAGQQGGREEGEGEEEGDCSVHEPSASSAQPSSEGQDAEGAVAGSVAFAGLATLPGRCETEAPQQVGAVWVWGELEPVA